MSIASNLVFVIVHFSMRAKIGFRCSSRASGVEEWTKTKTKFEAMDILNEYDIPCGPILSMKEIAEEPSLRKTGTVVEVDHPKRGKYLSVGNPIKMSESATEVKRSPLLGEHTDQVLAELGYSAQQIAELRSSGAI